MKKFIPIAFFLVTLVAPFSGTSQTRTVSGTVLSFEKFPLRNITVKARKAKTETKTDENGNFKLEVKNPDVIVIKDPAFITYTGRVTGTENSLKINLLIKNDEESMARAVSEGYISKENMEYGTKNLWHMNSEFNRFNDTWEAIKYALPETQIVVENGKKGVLMRGPKTLYGSNLALLVVDGVIVDDVSFVAPGEIVRITKLSTAKSALYGARAGNGVINIETK
ncbi:MAG TPA: hypothetical protein VI583_03085 [Cyclobacteriaceae bacterium]|nr:hypothetical protein [Cyclobacteriaceae bacterium]